MVTDGKLNDAIICHALDTKVKHILADLNPLQVTFKNRYKILLLAKHLTPIEISKLCDKRIKEQLSQLKDRKIEAQLLNLRRNNNFNNNYNKNNNNFYGRWTGNLPRPPPPLPWPGDPDEAFDPFVGATAALPSCTGARSDTSAPPYPGKIPPPPDYNTFFTETVSIADTDLNLRGTSTRKPVVDVIPLLSFAFGYEIYTDELSGKLC